MTQENSLVPVPVVNNLPFFDHVRTKSLAGAFLGVAL